MIKQNDMKTFRPWYLNKASIFVFQKYSKVNGVSYHLSHTLTSVWYVPYRLSLFSVPHVFNQTLQLKRTSTVVFENVYYTLPNM